MKTAIIVHGMPSKEEYFDSDQDSQPTSHWLPWIKHELSTHTILTHIPAMPVPYAPVYEAWKAVFEGLEIQEDTVLIGHSCGGGFLVRWLSENKMQVGKVVLVAPWIDPTHELDTGFFDFNIDERIVERTKGVTVLYSLDDDATILKTVEILKEKLPTCTFQEFTNKGHFTLSDMNTREFPELLQIVLQ